MRRTSYYEYLGWHDGGTRTCTHVSTNSIRAYSNPFFSKYKSKVKFTCFQKPILKIQNEADHHIVFSFFDNIQRTWGCEHYDTLVLTLYIIHAERCCVESLVNSERDESTSFIENKEDRFIQNMLQQRFQRAILSAVVPRLRCSTRVSCPIAFRRFVSMTQPIWERHTVAVPTMGDSITEVRSTTTMVVLRW